MLFAIDLHHPIALEHKVKFLTQPVVVAGGEAAGLDAGLGQTLAGDRGVAEVKDAADCRTVAGDKRCLPGQ